MSFAYWAKRFTGARRADAGRRGRRRIAAPAPADADRRQLSRRAARRVLRPRRRAGREAQSTR